MLSRMNPQIDEPGPPLPHILPCFRHHRGSRLQKSFPQRTYGMSDNAHGMLCQCGRTLKDSQARKQHIRDSARHQQRNAAPSPPPDRRPTCSCGRSFSTAEALYQHKRDSPFHAKRGTTWDTGETTYTSGRSVADENGGRIDLGNSSHQVRFQGASKPDVEKQPRGQERGGIVSFRHSQRRYRLAAS